MDWVKRKFRLFLRCVVHFWTNLIWSGQCIICGGMCTTLGCYNLCGACKADPAKHCEVYVEPDRYFDAAVLALPYEGGVRRIMRKFKFFGKKYPGPTFAYVMWESLCKWGLPRGEICLCCVPMHRAGGRRYNQAFVLAKEISRISGFEFCGDALIKSRYISPLKGKGQVFRAAMIKGNVDFDMGYNIKGKNVILIDDIYTTGSTVNECSKTLKMHGAESVTVLCACNADVKGESYYAHADSFSV